MNRFIGSRDRSVAGRGAPRLKDRRRHQALQLGIPFDRLERRVVLSTTSPLDTTIWTSIGPAPIVNGQTSGSQPVSGRITGVAGDPTNPLVDYIAAAGGGVWKTVNGGTSWTALTDNQATTFMGAIAVAPSNGQVIYAGTGEANNSGDSGYGRGILVSQDGGATWTLTTANGALDRQAISRIAVDPTRPGGRLRNRGRLRRQRALQRQHGGLEDHQLRRLLDQHHGRGRSGQLRPLQRRGPEPGQPEHPLRGDRPLRRRGEQRGHQVHQRRRVLGLRGRNPAQGFDRRGDPARHLARQPERGLCLDRQRLQLAGPSVP